MGKQRSVIGRELGPDRETVTCILSQQENQLLLQEYRQAVLRIVPNALIGLSHFVNQLDRTDIRTRIGPIPFARLSLNFRNLRIRELDLLVLRSRRSHCGGFSFRIGEKASLASINDEICYPSANSLPTIMLW